MNGSEPRKPDMVIHMRNSWVESETRTSKDTRHDVFEFKPTSTYLEIPGFKRPRKKNLAIALNETLLNLLPEKPEKFLHGHDQSTKPSKFRQLSTPKSDEIIISNRPGIEAFLIALSSCYNLYALSCWSTRRAAFIMQKACIDKFFTGIFEKKKSGVFVPGKSQRRGKILAESSKTIIVDSSREQISKNPSNGVLLRPFMSNEDDDDLLQLLPFLIYMAQFDDVRPIKRYYEMYSQQTKKLKGPFQAFIFPDSEDENLENTSCEDIDDEDDGQEASCKVSMILSAQNSGNINELKNRILKGHFTSTRSWPSKASTHAENTEKFSFRCLMEKDTLGDFNESTQHSDLFSRPQIKTLTGNQSKKFD